jgi:hypothetical protein
VAQGKSEETAEQQQNGGGPEEGPPIPQPGSITNEEMWTLYSAAEIKVRALNEQLAARDQVLAGGNELFAQVMQALGVDHIDKILPAIENLQKNRQARRSEKKPRARGGRKPATTGAKP